MWRQEGFRISCGTSFLFLTAVAFLCGCSPEQLSENHRSIDDFVIAKLPKGSMIETLEKDRVYRIKWKDEGGVQQRSVVTILQNSGLNESEQSTFLNEYEAAMRLDSMSFKKVNDQRVNSLKRRVEFRTSTERGAASACTIVLLMGSKIVEVILPHPKSENPALSQLNFVDNIKGV